MFGSQFYKHALCRQVSPNFVKALTMKAPSNPISVEVCQSQHQEFLSLMKKNTNINIFELEADPNCPDCMFTEDTSVVIGNCVIVSQPGDISRRGEIPPILEFWNQRKEDSNSKIEHVIEMSSYFNEG